MRLSFSRTSSPRGNEDCRLSVAPDEVSPASFCPSRYTGHALVVHMVLCMYVDRRLIVVICRERKFMSWNDDARRTLLHPRSENYADDNTSVVGDAG